MSHHKQSPVIVSSLTRRYDKVLALDAVSLEVGEGEIFGLIGPDGAGKTSLMRILATVLLPTAGSASVCGYDVVKHYRTVRKIIGYMPGRFSLYTDLTVEENLQFFATVFGASVSQNYELVKDIYSHIEPFKKRRAGQLSGGMKQKLALSCALIHRPRVLFLDEPTTGVDVVSRKELWEMLKNISRQGISVLVSTPYMDEATLCDRVALMQGGRFMDIDTPVSITGSFGKKLYAVRSSDMYRLAIDLKTAGIVRSSYLFGQTIHVTLGDECNNHGHLAAYLHRLGHAHVEVNPVEPNIEDCFIQKMIV